MIHNFISLLKSKKRSIGLLSTLSLLLLSTFARAQPGGFSHHYSGGTDTIFVKSQIIVRNASKDTLEIAGFKNGKKNGKQTLFYNNGDVNRIAYYKNDLLDGKVEYYSQGKKDPFRFEHYKIFSKEQKSLLHGVYKSFDSQGNLVEETIYKNGKKNGKYELYHNNGKIKEKGIFKNNLNIGRKFYYVADNVLLRDENYIIIDNPAFQKASLDNEQKNKNNTQKEIVHIPEKLSVLHGKVKYYHSNGQLHSDFMFKNGKKEGWCKEYYKDKNNTLKSEAVFKNGLEHGAFIYYRSNGNLERKGIYYREIVVGDTILKNVYDGTIEIYQDNGKKHRIENWKNFKKNGVQESYSYKSGELSERTHFIDNLKSGLEERFDKDGNRNYEAFYEIVEKDGRSVSQQTGTETYWEKDKVKTTVEWKNGVKEGVTKSYYSNGQLEKIMHFKDGKLYGSYQTFYENGQPKEDFNKQHWVGTGNSENVKWNTVYDESGNIIRKFFADKKGKIIISENFESGKRKNFIVNNIFRLDFSDVSKLSSVHWLNNARPTFGYDLFSNQQLRRIHFQIDQYPSLTANFSTDGNVVQAVSATGTRVEEEKAIEIAKKIALQYNPKWEHEMLSTQAFPKGKYQWYYKDNSSFFEIEFKDDLPQGKWIMSNPTLKDTLFYGEFNKGFPVGKWVRKKIDGIPELRQEYYPNHQLKESYRYENEGLISNITKNDSLGNRIFSEDYYSGGILKSRSIPTRSSYVNFSVKGDTLSYNLLFTKGDSIRIERQFFEENKLKVDRYNNFTSGVGSVKTYFENGKLQTSHELKNTKPHGIYQKFDENGTLLTLGNFKDGKRDGKWTNYKENGSEEISYFKEGEIVIEQIEESETDKNSCRCYDTSLAGNKIGFANSLAYFSDYKSIKPFIPKSIIPIKDWYYDKIFYINLRTDNGKRSGSTHFKLLLYNDFSFHYPVSNYLKFNLNPCKTEGYIGNLQVNVSYNFTNKELIYAQLHTKRIAVSLEKNPLVDAKDKSAFTAYFDTDHINFDATGIQSIHFSKEKNECFPLGVINDFMEIQIETAQLDIHQKNRLSTSNIPLLANEIKQFYGLEINAATIKFDIDSVQVEAICDKILAGANYVAGRIFVGGNLKNEDDFTFGDGKNSINIKNLKKVLEQKGFYRVKAEVIEHRLVIEFYAEK